MCLLSLPPQVVESAGNPSEYFLCEERVPLLKERSEVKRCAQYRSLGPEEEVVRVVSSWNTEDGCVGRIVLKTREEVHRHLNLKCSGLLKSFEFCLLWY